jgi:hypothetical protein
VFASKEPPASSTKDSSRVRASRPALLLDGYREWFNHHLEMMTDLDKRMPDGVRWLRKPG